MLVVIQYTKKPTDLKHPHRVQHRIPELFSGSDELQGYIRSLESDDCSDYEDDDTEDPTTSHQAGSLRNEHDSPEAQESDSEKAGDDQGASLNPLYSLAITDPKLMLKATADLEYESESAPTSTSALPDDWQWSFDESKSLDEGIVFLIVTPSNLCILTCFTFRGAASRDGVQEVSHDYPSQEASPTLPMIDIATAAGELAVLGDPDSSVSSIRNHSQK